MGTVTWEKEEKMTRLIDADVLCDRLINAWNTAEKESEQLICGVMAKVVTPIVVGTPTVDAEPVRHGHWNIKPLWKGSDAKYCECSVCGKPVWWVSDYCPNCGAKMDEVEDAKTD